MTAVTAISRDQRPHFIAEAQATSPLEHPGIAPVHDIGLTPDGRLYFTMKLVQGRTLRDVLHDLLPKRHEVHREYTFTGSSRAWSGSASRFTSPTRKASSTAARHLT
jgi:serine/threonine-protein kinase